MKYLLHIPRLTVRAMKWLFRVGRILAILLIFYVVYRFLLIETFEGTAYLLPALVIWVISAYIAIPWFHRLMTRYYLPNYYVGRIRSGDGLLSDPVNLAFFGSEKELKNAFEKAGWTLADPLTPRTIFKTAVALLTKKSYPNSPVGTYYLFNRKQDYAYQQEVGGTPRERHHIRIWKTPNGWRLPGGHECDWVAAATYDTTMGIKPQNGQIDHFIHENIDEERDYIIKTLKDAKTVKDIEVVEHFSDAFYDRNNGWGNIKTDGALPFITLK